MGFEFKPHWKLSHDSHLTVRGYLPTNAMKKEKQDEEN